MTERSLLGHFLDRSGEAGVTVRRFWGLMVFWDLENEKGLKSAADEDRVTSGRLAAGVIFWDF